MDLVALRELAERQGFTLESREGSTVRLWHPNGSFHQLDALDAPPAEEIEEDLKWLAAESEMQHKFPDRKTEIAQMYKEARHAAGGNELEIVLGSPETATPISADLHPIHMKRVDS